VDVNSEFRKEDPLSDQETNEPREDEDVEQHKGGKGSKIGATEEPKAEGDGNDDVELHAKKNFKL
jgi:hypothetical protein